MFLYVFSPHIELETIRTSVAGLAYPAAIYLAAMHLVKLAPSLPGLIIIFGADLYLGQRHTTDKGKDLASKETFFQTF